MPSTLFRDARVFDGQSENLAEGLEVLVEDGRIKEISDRPIQAGAARAIALGGRCLMPGLIDAHFHAIAADPDIGRLRDMPGSLLHQHARKLLEAALQRGFTTVRDAGGADYGLARATEAGLIRGPRLFYSGKALTQTGGHADFRGLEEDVLCLCCGGGAGNLGRVADGVPEVQKAARDELRKGATQIKIMGSGGISSPTDPVWNLQYSEAEIRAIVWEAQSWRTYVMAHTYTAEAIRRCVDYGVRSIEHGNLIDAETAAFCTEREAFVVPTLATYEALNRYGRDLGFPEVSLGKLKDVREAGVAALEILKAAGTRVGFGTDLLGDMQTEQLSEFRIRAEVLSPVEILRQATSLNAELLRRPEELGRVAPGALADLIVVDGDPTRDLGVFDGQGEGVLFVMKGGAIYKDAL